MADIKDEVAELEELLVGLDSEGPVGAYSEDDDEVTLSMAAPVGDQEWMVQLSPLNRKMMSTDRLVQELTLGTLTETTLVWRGGMEDWVPINQVDALTRARQSVPPPRPPPSRQALPPVPARARVADASGPMGASANFVSDEFNGDDDDADVDLEDIAAAPPPPVPFPPAAAPPAPRSYTGRPVAVDFSSVPPKPRTTTRLVFGAGAAAVLTVLVTLYSLSRGGVFESSAASTEGRAVRALEPAASPSAAQAVAPSAPVAEAAPVPTPPAEAATPAQNDAPAASEAAASETAKADENTSAEAVDGSALTPAARAKLRRKLRAAAAGRAKTAAKTETAAVAEATPASNPAAPEPAASPAKQGTLLEAMSDRVARNNKKTMRAKAKTKATPAPSADESNENAEASAAVAPTTGFNRQAAQAALKEAAAQAGNCRPVGGPTGSGKVQVRYDASGRVGAVSFLTPGFDTTTTGSCVQMVFRRAKIQSFSGASVTLTESFEIR